MDLVEGELFQLFLVIYFESNTYQNSMNALPPFLLVGKQGADQII